MDVQEAMYEDVNEIHLTWDRDKFWVPTNTVMNLWDSLKAWDLLTIWATISF
jgi:hypothetical protein